jgi:hypothetical protein
MGHEMGAKIDSLEAPILLESKNRSTGALEAVLKGSFDLRIEGV